jgi:hypothetical protein
MPECNEWGIVSTWVSPHLSSDVIPPTRGEDDPDSDIEEVPPPEATGSRRGRRISNLADWEHRPGPSSSAGGSSSGGTHCVLYDNDDDDDDLVPLAHRRRTLGVKETPVPLLVMRPMPGEDPT